MMAYDRRLMSKQRATVDGQLADVETAHLESVYGKGAHTTAFHRKRANSETSDSQCTDRGGPKCEGAHGGSANAAGADHTYRHLVGRDLASGNLSLSNLQ